MGWRGRASGLLVARVGGRLDTQAFAKQSSLIQAGSSLGIPCRQGARAQRLSLIHISEPTRLALI
eukprot:1852038-Alexandrium_andersonii.AAC.1